MRTMCSLLALCAPAITAPAQQTWIVDSQNRPGTQFTDIQPAVDAATPGDRIVVRDGSYSTATVGKGVWIDGQPGAVISTPLVGPALVVSNLPAGQTCRVSSLVAGTLGTRVEVISCAGTVHIEDFGSAGLPGRILDTTDSARISLARCGGTTPAAIRITRSNVNVTQCTLEGFDSQLLLPGPSSPAVDLIAGTAELSDTVATGGDGLWGSTPWYGYSGSPAVKVGSGARVRVTGDSSLAGGWDPYTNVRAVEGAGSAWIDPRVVVQGALSTGVVTTVPSLALTAAQVGGTSNATLQSEPGRAWVAAVGLAAAPQPTPWQSDWWLAPGTATVARSGVTDPATGNATFAVRVPNLSALQGLLVSWQGATDTAAGLRLTNPVDQLIR